MGLVLIKSKTLYTTIALKGRANRDLLGIENAKARLFFLGGTIWAFSTYSNLLLAVAAPDVLRAYVSMQ
jgi:hypothetical protein